MKFDFSEIRYNGTDIRKHTNLPDYPTPELAEIVGIMLGDGCLYLDRRLKFHTVICFNKKETQYLNYVKILFESYFNPYKFSIQELENEFLLRNISKFIGKFLVSNGLKHGNKIKNKVEIPEGVFSNREFVVSLVKGIFDTDGSIYRKYANYAQICFKFAGYPLIASVRESLMVLGYNPTKIIKGNSSIGGIDWKFYLSRQEEVNRFFLEIKPANDKHLKRFKNIRMGTLGLPNLNHKDRDI